MLKDELFLKEISTFEFNDDVANVFDDMLNRSVPFYSNILNQMAQLAADVVHRYPQKNIYDLGCSLGTWASILNHHVEHFNYIGMDASEAMIQKANQKKCRRLSFIKKNIETIIELPNAGVIACNLVLQFIPIMHRERLIQLVYKSLPKGGRFLLVEKIHAPDHFEDSYTRFYHDYKLSNGYSPSEIKNKARALEHVLKTQSQAQYERMLAIAGFQSPNIFFKWYNFIGMVVEKNE